MTRQTNGMPDLNYSEETFRAMYAVMQRIMSLDVTTPLEAMAYSGGDIPKKWLREEAPILEARAKYRKEIQEMIRPILAKAEARNG